MRNYLGALAAVAVAASAGANAQTLYVGGPGGSAQKMFEEKIIPGFEAKHGVKVVYVPGNSTDLLAKLLAQKGKQDMSLAIIDDGPMFQATEQGLCAPVENAGAVKDIYPNAHLPGGMALGIGFVATGLAYNTEVFARNGWSAPTSWLDLADPKYRGKVVIPPISNGYGLLTLVMEARLHGGSEDKIDPGFDFMKNKVAPNVLAWEGSPGNMAQMMQTGEAALVVWGNGRVQSVVDQGAPVKFVYPKEGAMVIMTAACVINGAPMADLGQKFLQDIVSPETQALLAVSSGFGPVNPNTKLSDQDKGKVVFGPDQVNALLQPNYGAINPNRAEWTRRWDRQVER